MIESGAKHTPSYPFVPPIAISDSTRWSSTSFNGNFAARRADCIILIICIHNGLLSEEGRIWRNCWAASMRVSQRATFVSRSVSLPGCFCGSFGGMKTCSTTEVKKMGWMDMIVENEIVGGEVMRYTDKPAGIQVKPSTDRPKEECLVAPCW